MTDDKLLLTQAEAAKLLGTTVGTLNTWRHQGKTLIPYIRWGRRIRYRKCDIEAFLANELVPVPETS